MNEWTLEQWNDHKNSGQLTMFYIYTPLCGTCQVASKMMQVVQEMKPFSIGQANINYLENFAMDYHIESVPCLIIAKGGTVYKKIYAFQSVPFILETIKSIDEQVVV
ncbi:thioredoxin family protein [Psychrobacillus psychrodurans]|uniref:Thioredoxin family protein n=1 Tax=Psychrobacillus psychrodurans TaxID=126157 RepID=A0A9X3LCT2_9BACI|nr:thioredoxin family protein [Psychrobacillus psychrodurans]MCZ8535437.1 thioredoxin family protein [Psychrobacillus psychrodurans]